AKWTPERAFIFSGMILSPRCGSSCGVVSALWSAVTCHRFCARGLVRALPGNKRDPHRGDKSPPAAKLRQVAALQSCGSAASKSDVVATLATALIAFRKLFMDGAGRLPPSLPHLARRL